jgi:hypothetical protein
VVLGGMAGGPTRGDDGVTACARGVRGGRGAQVALDWGGAGPLGRPGHGGGAGSAREPTQERGFSIFPFFHFSFLGLNSIPRMLFINHSTTSKKIMIWHDATTEENISRVYSHKVSS